MGKEISLSDLFSGSEIRDCYMLDGGYCYPVTDISEVTFSDFPLINITHSERSYLAIEVTCDDQVFYLLYIRPIQKRIPINMRRRPLKMTFPAYI